MHVFLTANSSWNIWNFRLPVVRALLDGGHRVTILAPADHTVQDLQNMGCRVIPLEMNAKGLNPLEELKLRRRFLEVFRRERPDIILSYTIKNNTLGGLAAKALGIPFLPNVSGLGTGFLSGGALRFVTESLYRRAFRSLPVVFFQNADDRDLFVARKLVTPGQARLLPGSGIDLDRFRPEPLPATAPVFLLIARLLRDKGVLEFVEAARRIRRDRPDVRFRLLGAAGAENRTAISAATVEGWVAEGVVEHLGTTSDVRPAIAEAHCVVLPSYREGAPRTLIEAAAMGRPLVATDVPGCRAVVDHDETGFLCTVRDADSLEGALRRVLALPPESLATLGRAGRGKMEREFDQTLVVNAYLDAIREIAEAAASMPQSRRVRAA